MIKKVIMNRDLSKVFGPDCIPLVVLKNCEPEIPYILAELVLALDISKAIDRFWHAGLLPKLKSYGI